MIVFFFGQPGAGKTTLAKQFIREVYIGSDKIHLDGDDLREIFSDKNFSKEGRERNIQRAMDIIIYENSKNDLVVCSFVMPFNHQRIQMDEQANILWFFLCHDEAKRPTGKKDYTVPFLERPSGLKNLIEIDTDIESEGRTYHWLLHKFRKFDTIEENS